MNTAPRPIRIGVIGAGTISQSVHLPLVRRAGFDLAWVADISPSRAEAVGSAYGARWTSTPSELLAADDVDAVLIATPGAHSELTIAALDAGKHVLAEKPLGLSLAAIDAVSDAAARSGLVVQVGYMKMYDPLVQRARAELDALHTRRLVRITVSHPADEPQVAHLRMRPTTPDVDPAFIAAANAAEEAEVARALPGASPALRAYYRNVLNGSVVHEFSLLRALGLPLPDAWTADTFPTLDGDEPACLLATAAPDAGVRYVLSWNWLPDHPEYSEELKVLAASRRLDLHLAKPYLLEERSRLRVERSEGSERRETTYTELHESAFLRQLDAFGRSVRDGAPVVATVAGARLDLVQCQRLAKAIGAGLGETVTIEADADAEANTTGAAR
ncbi:MAG: Gfo/Idh/MocA family oxidoreductase [Actinobacteria bacterium]|nr:Gfo/Idh/MocA family oxidoreductase [Actinomycetota bacterium]